MKGKGYYLLASLSYIVPTSTSLVNILNPVTQKPYIGKEIKISGKVMLYSAWCFLEMLTSTPPDYRGCLIEVTGTFGKEWIGCMEATSFRVDKVIDSWNNRRLREVELDCTIELINLLKNVPEFNDPVVIQKITSLLYAAYIHSVTGSGGQLDIRSEITTSCTMNTNSIFMSMLMNIVDLSLTSEAKRVPNLMVIDYIFRFLNDMRVNTAEQHKYKMYVREVLSRTILDS